MKTIPLTQGKVTVVDDDVYEWASKFKWIAQQAGNRFYAIRKAWNKQTKQQYIIRLHREILKLRPSETLVGHHINGDGLDNQRCNLQKATRSQDRVGFRRPCSGKTSQFRGVSWIKRQKQWSAQITIGNRKRHLGTFDDEKSAAEARDTFVKGVFGGTAQLNFP